jgi:hypothetical protein
MKGAPSLAIAFSRQPRPHMGGSAPLRKGILARVERRPRAERGGGARAGRGPPTFQKVTEPTTVDVATVDVTLTVSPVTFHELGHTTTSC